MCSSRHSLINLLVCQADCPAQKYSIDVNANALLYSCDDMWVETMQYSIIDTCSFHTAVAGSAPHYTCTLSYGQQHPQQNLQWCREYLRTLSQLPHPSPCANHNLPSCGETNISSCCSKTVTLVCTSSCSSTCLTIWPIHVVLISDAQSTQMDQLHMGPPCQKGFILLEHDHKLSVRSPYCAV